MKSILVHVCLFAVAVLIAGCEPSVPETVLHREQRRVVQLNEQLNSAAAVSKMYEWSLMVSTCAISVLLAVLWRASRTKRR